MKTAYCIAIQRIRNNHGIISGNVFYPLHMKETVILNQIFTAKK